MNHTTHLVLSVLLFLVSYQPPQKGPVLPPLPKAPDIPTPVVDPSVPVTVQTGDRYVVHDSTKCIVAVFPPDAVKIGYTQKGTWHDGPLFLEEGKTLIMSGRFISGSGVVDEMEFTGPRYIYILHPTKSYDTCWLLVSEVGSETYEKRLLKIVTGTPVDPVDPVDPSVDPLTKAIRAAYAADTSLTKADDKIKLAAVYRAIADAVPSIKTVGGLATVIEDSRKARIDDRLPTLRVLFAKEFARHIPDNVLASTPLTDTQKTIAKSEFIRFATILEGIK